MHLLQVDQPLFDLNMGPLDDILDVYSWEGLALSQYFLESSNHTCSTLMLANVTLSDNEAVGAGGSFFINNPLDFHNFCPEDIGTGAATGIPLCSLYTAAPWLLIRL